MTELAASNVRVRPVRPEDYDGITAVWSAGGLEVKMRGRDRKEAFLKQLDLFQGLYWVAVDGDRIVGVVFGTHDGRKGWINRLAVLPEYRRQGIAAALVTRCDQAIRATGIGIVVTLVEVDNETSAKLFRKLGYSDDVPVRYLRKLDHPDV